MSQNQEIIEAKLCAYIDGELDPDGRAEIEKHLEANPQHRRLLESLKATRDLVRWLPREPAPPELAETLNGQLERSVLLDYDGDSLRPRIFPRVFAAAAIVVLTAGLAAAVYFALPKSHRNATQIAVNSGGEQPKGAEPERSSGLADGRESRDRESLRRYAKGGPEDAGAFGSTGGPEVAKLGSDLELDEVARQVAANPDAVFAAATGANYAATEPASPAINSAVVMLVRSDKPGAAEKELTGYLTSNQIQWRCAGPQQTDLNAAAQQVRNDAVPGRRAASETVQQKAATVESNRQRFGGRSEANPAPSESLANRGGDGLSGARVPTTQPGSRSELAQQTDKQLPASDNFDQGAVAQRSLLNNSSRANCLYVARMSRSQARAFSTTMNERGLQAAEVKDAAAGTQSLAAPSLNEATASNQATSEGEANAGPTTRSAARERYAKQVDASISPHQEPPQNFHFLPKSAPSTQPVADMSRGQSDLAVALKGESAGGATTQPAASQPLADESSDEPVNVVIVVEPSPQEPANGAVPATQPSSPTAVQPAPTQTLAPQTAPAH